MAERRFHTSLVVERRSLTPGMVRIVVGGPGLRAFVSTGIGDECVRLYFPDPETGAIVHPHLGEVVGDGPDRPAHSEVYTVRGFDPERRELVLDFVVHEGGRASEWACAAQPGERLVLSDPHGLHIPPQDAPTRLFLSDATGLPALARLLEGLPAGASARAIIEIADASHRQDLTSPAKLDVMWIDGRGNGVGPSRLPEVLRALPREALADHVWVAGEHKAARAIRVHLRKELALLPARYSVVGYWIDRRADWEAGWAALDPAIKARISSAWASDREREDVRDQVEHLLEKVGL